MTATSTEEGSNQPKMRPEIEIEDVSLSYATPEGRLSALSGLALHVNSGEAVSIIGPSGCGKSTLLHLLAGLDIPTTGTVRISGEPVTGPRSHTAYIPQDLGLFPWKSALANVEFGLRVQGYPRHGLSDRSMRALSAVGLEDFARSYPRSLSGGMRQRLALARAIALDMDILLMDEPLSALDALTRENMQDTLLDLWLTQGQTQVLVTHSIGEAVYLGQRIFVLAPRPGRLVSVIDNPGMGGRGYRDSGDFSRRCSEVRTALQFSMESSDAPTGSSPDILVTPGDAR